MNTKDEKYYEEKISQWLNGEISNSDKNEFENYMIKTPSFKKQVDEYKTIWEQSVYLKTTNQLSGDERWERIEDNIKSKSLKQQLILFSKVSAAAVLLIGILLIIGITNVNEVVTQKGEQKNIILPDGSEVFLNVDSRIEYNKYFFKYKRNIDLEGEAFFNVKKDDNLFRVNCSNSVIEVLGTSFNIKSRNNINTIACTTGKVKVISLTDNSHKILKLQEGVIVSDQISEITQIDTEKINSWMNGNIYFSKTPILEVFNDLERYYNINIDCQIPRDTITFNGYFEDPEIQNVLNIICLTTGLHLQNENNSYIISQP